MDYDREQFLSLALNIAEQTNEQHPAWAIEFGRNLDHLTMYNLIGSRDELIREIELLMVRASEDTDLPRNEYFTRQLVRLREQTLTEAERAELDELAARLA